MTAWCLCHNAAGYQYYLQCILIRMECKYELLSDLVLKAMRFSHLMAALPNIKQGPLAEQLKELIAKGLVCRTAYDEMPPHVEYQLTDKGESFLQVLRAMDEWVCDNLFS